MNETKLRIIQKALNIILDNIDDDLYDWLLDNTDARPGDTAYCLESLITGIAEASVHYEPTKDSWNHQ